MIIRLATEADVPAMLAVHRQAVRQTASGFYDSAVIDAWSATSEPDMQAATIARMTNVILSGEVIGFVAVIGDAIAGFGELVPKDNVLGAIYVHPDHGRKGVGAALVTVLQAKARELGLRELTMDASLNAEAFYRRHGFSVVAYDEHELRNGLKMPCVKMRKILF